MSAGSRSLVNELLSRQEFPPEIRASAEIASCGVRAYSERKVPFCQSGVPVPLRRESTNAGVGIARFVWSASPNVSWQVAVNAVRYEQLERPRLPADVARKVHLSGRAGRRVEAAAPADVDFLIEHDVDDARRASGSFLWTGSWTPSMLFTRPAGSCASSTLQPLGLQR